MEQKVVSSFFNSSLEDTSADDISEDVFHLIDELNLSLEQFKIPKKVDAVYNPTIYARQTFEMYVRKYCNTRKPIMYFGMNPGPWGMSQTGVRKLYEKPFVVLDSQFNPMSPMIPAVSVPFGEISSVRDWLGICGPVEKPPNEVKARPVLGFECSRTEISGQRFWGLFKTLCGTPENFFKTSFVYNYLPQQWMTSTGCNLTPGDFKKSEVQELYNICDPIFIKILELYQVEKIVAVGKFCETRAKETLKRHSFGRSIEIIYLPHPSPRVVNNTNWATTATECLKKSNLLQYYQQDSVTTT